ncbi:MAG: hypothetical protein ABW150_08095 [Candidatus Thiodiazotropha sp.]
MFQPKQHPFMEPPKEADDEAAQCTQLAKRIEALKGKPQRRRTLSIDVHGQGADRVNWSG